VVKIILLVGLIGSVVGLKFVKSEPAPGDAPDVRGA
jgi:hypothetical protein